MLRSVAKSGNRYLNDALWFVSKEQKPLKSTTQTSSTKGPVGQPKFYYQPTSNTASTPTTINLTATQKKASPDRFKFENKFATYVHHGGSSKSLVNSLMDFTDSSNSLSLLPRRRLYGNPIETLSIKNGDDAMIVSPNLIGVADGVSGWSGAHANSGLFARSFLENISRNFSELSFKNSKNLKNIKESDLSENLDFAYQDSIQIMNSEKFHGSSTLLIGMIIDDILKVMNIGDSKIFVIRNGKIVESNSEQYLAKLCPEQVGTMNTDKVPSSVVEYKDFALQEDDLILVCSDGVTDNLYPDEILEIINRKIDKDESNLQEVCNALLYKSKSIAFDDYCVSPYVEKVNELNKQFITGGKLDDISICISKVSLNT